MPAIHLDHVSFRHTTAVDLLHDVTLHVGAGWTGIVGTNGSGKTTLLRLVSGELTASEGRIVIDPAAAVIASCAQEVGEPSPAIRHLAEAWEGPEVTLRGRLALDPGDLVRWETMSPGERKRWQVGSALAMRPDVLLLDEPTNHLDRDGRAWLVDAVRGFGGVGLIVSHDRTLLDELTERTIRVAHGVVTLWSGGYGAAREGWLAAERGHQAEYRRLRREQRKVERRIADQRRASEQKRARFQRQMRTSDIKDIDARSAAATGVFRAGEQAAARELATSVRARDRIAEEAEGFELRKELGRTVFVDYEPSPKRDLAVRRGPLVVAERVLVKEANAALERTDRVWLRGPNGAGKTTLVEDLLRRAGLPEDRVLFLPQELPPDAGDTYLAAVRAMPPDVRGGVLAIVAALGVDPDVLLASERPSPGELRKLAMAIGLGRRAWLLVLDEPTNHLDLPSIERLEAALQAYPGALVVVTHDDAFGAALDLHEWWIEDGTLRT